MPAKSASGAAAAAVSDALDADFETVHGEITALRQDFDEMKGAVTAMSDRIIAVQTAGVEGRANLKVEIERGRSQTTAMENRLIRWIVVTVIGAVAALFGLLSLADGQTPPPALLLTAQDDNRRCSPETYGELQSALENRIGARLNLYAEQHRLGGSLYDLEKADNPVEMRSGKAYGEYCDAVRAAVSCDSEDGILARVKEVAFQAEQRAAVRVELLLVRLGASDIYGPGNVAVWEIEKAHKLSDPERTALWEYFELKWERDRSVLPCVIEP